MFMFGYTSQSWAYAAKYIYIAPGINIELSIAGSLEGGKSDVFQYFSTIL